MLRPVLFVCLAFVLAACQTAGDGAGLQPAGVTPFRVKAPDTAKWIGKPQDPPNGMLLCIGCGRVAVVNYSTAPIPDSNAPDALAEHARGRILDPKLGLEITSGPRRQTVAGRPAVVYSTVQTGPQQLHMEFMLVGSGRAGLVIMAGSREPEAARRALTEFVKLVEHDATVASR